MSCSQIREACNASRLGADFGGRAGQAALNIEERIKNDPFSELNLVASFGNSRLKTEVLAIETLASFIEDQGIQEVWIAVPWEEKDLLEQSLFELKESVVDINVVPDLHQYRLLNQSISDVLSGLRNLSIQVRL